MGQDGPKPPEFMTPRYHGSRFMHDGRMPVEVLVELDRYKQLLVAVAAELFRREYPNRVRVPANFADSFVVTLGELLPGSSQAVCYREVPPSETGMIPGLNLDFFERAHDLTQRTIRSANDNDREVLDEFPRKLLPRFNELGSSLMDGEYIDFGSHQKPARLDHAVRRRLVTSVTKYYSRLLHAEFEVIACDDDKLQGTIRVEGRRVDARCSTRDMFDPIRDGYAKRYPVEIIGDLYLNAKDEPQFVHVEEAELLEPPPADFEEDLREIASLDAGWYDGEDGEPVSPELVSQVRAAVRHLVLNGVRAPHAFATAEGAVRVEWPVRSDYSLSIEFSADGRAYLHCSNVATTFLQQLEIASSEFARILEFVSQFEPRAEV